VVVPREAATRSISGAEVTDVKNIGPVYLGLYPSVRDDLYSYTHPEVGPLNGDAYPYGGTTVGDTRFACVEALSCRAVSGRYTSMDELVSWWSETWGIELLDGSGNAITNGEELRQVCYDLMAYTSDEEVRISVTEDKNEDGAIDAADLDFVENGDGDFVGTFTFWQQEFFTDEAGTGFTLWGWMDSSNTVGIHDDTCLYGDEGDAFGGFTVNDYTTDFIGPVQNPELLNFPSEYISPGDYVASEGYVYASPDDADVTLTLDWRVD
jgi:hypothetical protein